ncbi:hypothetical protein ACIRFH_01335 [Streptomyces sp. NPDC093586]|uniref:hypothetical protein n=1 Tax=Streptomyces sp. NPDC093586 TaxID=3366042 RepID=UPI0037F75B6C
MKKRELPACARGHFDQRQTFVALSHRKDDDWHHIAGEMIKHSPALHGVDTSELRDSVMEISHNGALQLATLISVGSLLYGPRSLPNHDHERDTCLSRVLDCAGEGARYFTNHGEAEEGDEADFLSSAFHANTLADATIDVCLIGVSEDAVLILWRFEDD